MNFFKKKSIIIVAVVVVIVLIIGGLWWYNTIPGKYDDFAKCLKDHGVKFYGAFWCPHCQAQKKLFEKSQKYIPYIECSTPDGKNQLDVCDQAGVKAYPTWEFKDGARSEGELTFQQLSDKSACPLP